MDLSGICGAWQAHFDTDPVTFSNFFLGLKGVSAKVIILEEASRLDQAVFFEVVVPLLGVSNT